MKNYKQTTNSSGFTILELLIASTVFSVILMMVTFGIMRIGQAYKRGVNQSRTQEVARNILNEISNAVKFSGGTLVETYPNYNGSVLVGNEYPSRQIGDSYSVCLNGFGYAYILDKLRVLDNNTSGNNPDRREQVFIRTPANCKTYPNSDGLGYSPTPASQRQVNPDTAVELVGIGMRVTQLDVSKVPGTDRLYKITVGVATGDRDLFYPDPTGVNPITGALTGPISEGCKTGAGSQFCAITVLSTVVERRIDK